MSKIRIRDISSQWLRTALTGVVLFVLCGCAAPRHTKYISELPPDTKLRPYPDYPEQALSNGWHGEVILAVQIGDDLHASPLQVEKSSGHDILDNAAQACVAKWTFPQDTSGSQFDVSIDFEMPE
jgi:TonB family protein